MMLDQIQSTTNNQNNHHNESHPAISSTNQTSVDFNSILQELKSVGEVHQIKTEANISLQQTTSHYSEQTSMNIYITFFSLLSLSLSMHSVIFWLIYSVFYSSKLFPDKMKVHPMIFSLICRQILLYNCRTLTE